MNYKDLWTQVKSSVITKNSTNQILQTWFESTELINVSDGNNSSTFKLGVPSKLHKFWISQNLLGPISSELAAVYHSPFHIEIEVNETAQDHILNTQPNSPNHKYIKPIQSEHSAYSATHTNMPSFSNINPEYTFYSFVVGRNNEFAHAASWSISEKPGQDSYNPLFICGPTGMGKTHLLNAVGNHIKEKFPQLRVTYVSSERFLNECITSIKTKKMEEFRKKFRIECDVLLMDDIQLLGRGEAVQNEFFHTLNDFFDKGQQVVVASDRMPKDIGNLEDRIRTRLEWGLIADIQMPDIETRVAILRYKAERKALRISQDVINYIARISKRSIRELEGNLNKVKMFSELQGLNITLEIAKKVLANHDDSSSGISVSEIQKIVADYMKVRLIDIKSKSRMKPIVTARQIAMYLIRKYLNKSLVDIGRAFGGKDHTTVINSLRKIETKMEKDPTLRKDIEYLENKIHNITGV